MPVMLMHGMGLMGTMGRRGMLDPIALYLRLHGCKAFAPNVAPYHHTEIRALTWKNHLLRILNETKSDKIHLIAHSLGGLDARFLVSNLGMAPHVAQITTIATPHHGSYLATFFLKKPALLSRSMVRLLDFTGQYSLPDTPSNALKALQQLTPEYMINHFNVDVQDHPEVVYRSIAARAGKNTPEAISPLLFTQNRILYGHEGENDGLVSVKSAIWRGFSETIEADHLTQIAIAPKNKKQQMLARYLKWAIEADIQAIPNR